MARVKIVDVHEFPTGVYRWSVRLECGHMLLRDTKPKQKTVNVCHACVEEREWEKDEKSDEHRRNVPPFSRPTSSRLKRAGAWRQRNEETGDAVEKREPKENSNGKRRP